MVCGNLKSGNYRIPGGISSQFITGLIFALVYVFTGKTWCVRGVLYTAVLSTCAAACPNLMRSEIMVAPNVLFPILMAVLSFLAYRVGKKAESKTVAPRLDIKH